MALWLSAMTSNPDSATTPTVAILVLNYHQPEATLACVQSLLAREGTGTRVIWIENDAAQSRGRAETLLNDSGIQWTQVNPSIDPLPPAGTVAYLPNPENLGYGGGNNVGLRWIHRLGVPFAWVLNNDTLLRAGSSAELVSAAEARPEVGLWGMRILSDVFEGYIGGLIKMKDFGVLYIGDPDLLDNPHTFISGCTMFMRTELAASVGFIPEEYFLYYEDPAFSLEIRRRGHRLSVVPEVEVFHHENFSTGRRSPLTEYYNRRNRWHFIRTYFPEKFKRQVFREPYVLQRFLFRGKLDRIRIEYLAWKDYQGGRLGRCTRKL